MILCVGGLGGQAAAQTPSFSPPALPPIPGLATPSGPTPVGLPPLPTITIPGAAKAPTLAAPPVVAQAPSPALAPLPALPGVSSATVSGKLPELGKITPPPNAGTDTPPPSPEAGFSESLANGAPPPPVIAGLPALATPSLDAAILPPLGDDGASDLPNVEVVRTPPKRKTWLSSLAPSIIPPKTNFNYRQQRLPETVYRTQYDRENQHLPKRVTDEDYQALLFASVAKNDINATRALLNAGTGLGITNPYGETPLAYARRSGAVDVVALLEARGAR